MRVLWWSNHPTAPTGYGQQTAIWCRQLRDAGHDVIISANYGGEPRAHHWEGIPVLPPGEHPYAQDSLAEDHVAVEPDLTWCLYDAWPIETKFEGRAAIWTPVDHTPLPPKVKHSIETCGATAVAMSEWGSRQLAGNGLGPLYVPHGIDTDVFEPRDRKQARARLGLDPDAFLVGMVAANKGQFPIRKNFDGAFRAFSWLASHRPDAQLYVHSRPTSKVGVNLPVMAKTYGIPSDRVTFANPMLLRVGVSDTAMSWIYSAFDVLLAPSLGEGFGIPVIEAQACGVPVIVTDATAQTELCGAGWLASGELLWDDVQAADWVRPLDVELFRALGAASEQAATMRDTARTFAERYDYRTVWPQFAQVLDELVPSWEPIAA